MNRLILTGALAGALALPILIAPASASASCRDRPVTGTVVGGVGGALIGNSIARGGGGAVLGGLGGAVLGHEVARSTCGREHYRSRRAEYRGGYRPNEPVRQTYEGDAYPSQAQYAPGASQHRAYYDDRGNLIDPGGVAAPAAYAPGAYASATDPGACRPVTQSYYNYRGELVQAQTCAR